MSAGILDWVIQQLTTAPSTWSWTKLLTVVGGFGAAILVTLKSFTTFVGLLLKLRERIEQLGVGTRWSREVRLENLRRKQFCTMLASDLASLAKAENWNDQYFSDLEAEVEAEGRFFASRLHKALRHHTIGVRRVRSLLRAIERSAENRLLMVGEPGSGKSVALRHLAHQFAEKTRKSKSTRAQIPLYVNLRELARPQTGKVSANHIREFVFENVRRGDSDLADYVSSKWQEYLTTAQWVFLFDSFDEIADVLHASNDNEVIHEYSEAIRHFLDGVGDCKAIVASREFKGPRQLPWHKIRIMPLSDKRQRELIGKAFLTLEHKDLVERHVANSDPHTYRNPMFLGLLCRFVKDMSATPTNDHQLLVRHINRLAQRDPTYLLARFALDPDQLLRQAGAIAALLAEDADLTLAPTADALVNSLKPMLAEDATRLLDALVYMKIGRTDLPGASSQVRRFAFAHRRYQETLYVNHLTTREHQERPRTLLLSHAMREYVVTFLESQTSEMCKPLIDDAIAFLKNYAKRQQKIVEHDLLDSKVGYFDWEEDGLAHVLSLLRDGFRRKPHEISDDLRQAVDGVLLPRFLNQDSYDRCKVLEFACLMGRVARQRCLEIGMNYSSSLYVSASTQSIAFIGSVEATLQRRFLRALSDLTIQAADRTELLRLELLAARMSDPGAMIVYRRSRLLNKIQAIPRVILDTQLHLLKKLSVPVRGNIGPHMTIMGFAMLLGFGLPLALAYLKGGLEKFDTERLTSTAMFISLGVVIVTLSISALLFAFRSEPRRISFNLILKRIFRLPGRAALRDSFTGIVALVGAVAFLLLPGGIVWLYSLVFGVPRITPVTFVVASSVSTVLLGLTLVWREMSQSRGFRERLEKAIARYGKNRELTLAGVLNARSFNEARNWLVVTNAPMHWAEGDARALLRIFSIKDEKLLPKSLAKYPLFQLWRSSDLDRRRMRDTLLRMEISRSGH